MSRVVAKSRDAPVRAAFGGDAAPGTRIATLERVSVRFTVATEGTTRRIRVEGRLAGEAVQELDELTAGDPPSVCLDLSELRSADARGVALLHRLRLAGSAMRDVPPHLAWRIEGG